MPGLRTHIMVGMGAALFTIVGAELGMDRTRMAAQVVSGIGFIGAGTIFRAGDSIKGLTTAAGMWTVAGIGVAAGFGMLLLAMTATVVALRGPLRSATGGRSDRVQEQSREKPTSPTNACTPRG